MLGCKEIFHVLRSPQISQNSCGRPSLSHTLTSASDVKDLRWCRVDRICSVHAVGVPCEGGEGESPVKSTGSKFGGVSGETPNFCLKTRVLGRQWSWWDLQMKNKVWRLKGIRKWRSHPFQIIYAVPQAQRPSGMCPGNVPWKWASEGSLCPWSLKACSQRLLTSP